MIFSFQRSLKFSSIIKFSITHVFIAQLSNNQPQSSAPHRCLSLQTSKTFHSLATAPSLLTRFNLPHTLKGCNHSHRCGKQSIAAILPLVWVCVSVWATHIKSSQLIIQINAKPCDYVPTTHRRKQRGRYHRKSPSGRAFQKGRCAVDRKYKTFEELLRAARNVIKHLPPLRPDWFLLAINHTSEERERDRNHKRGGPFRMRKRLLVLVYCSGECFPPGSRFFKQNIERSSALLRQQTNRTTSDKCLDGGGDGDVAGV